MSYSIHAPDPSGSFGRPMNPEWLRDGALPRRASAITRELTAAGIAVSEGASARTMTWSVMAVASATLALVWLARWAQPGPDAHSNLSLGVATLNMAGTLACLGVLTKGAQRAARVACIGGAAVALATACFTILS